LKKRRLLSALTTIVSLLALAVTWTLSPAVTHAQPATDPADIPGVYQPANPHLYAEAMPRVKSSAHGDDRLLGPARPHYRMNVTYDANRHVITGTMNVSFANNLGFTLRDLYFNVWANARNFTEAGGGTQIQSVKVNGKPAVFSLNETALHITGLNLSPNSRPEVQIAFTVKVPNLQDRFGWYGSTVSLGNWFPILAVYDEEGWNTDPYFPYGESFYSLTGNFDVLFTTDRSQVVAATGTQVGKTIFREDSATYHFQAHNVRDFAMELDPNYHIRQTSVGNVKINVYYTDRQAKYADAMLEAGRGSIALFSEKFGKYPWPELDIVSMEGWFGGMEYPQLIMMSLNDNRTQEWVKSVTAHEIGHQWFYGIIGNNEYDEPWLDESFATFAAALYMNDLDGLTTEPTKEEYYHVSSPVSTFTQHANEGGINAYRQMIYGYGSRTLNELRMELGDDTFYRAMHAWFRAKKFGVATTRDFIRIMQQTSGRDLHDFFVSHRVYVNDQE